MKDNLDDTLKAYFAPRDEIPEETRAQLRMRLKNAARQEEKVPPVWIPVPFAALASVVIILAAGMIFGQTAALVIGLVYYSVTALTFVSVLIPVITIKATSENPL